MIRLTPESETRTPQHVRRHPRWGRLVLLLLPLVLAAALMAEHWRGQRALGMWQRDMRDRGEIFDAARLWPSLSAADARLASDLAMAVGMLSPLLYDYANSLSGVVPVAPGTARRGSQEPQPLFGDPRHTTNSWQNLDALVREGERGFQSLRQLLKHAPTSQGYDILKQLKQDSMPNLVELRYGAQALQAAVVNDLHRDDLAAAAENLEALSAFARLYAKDPWLVNFMMRICILGLGDEAYWDALQSDGWSEAQLARLGQACQYDAWLTEMSRAMEADRACHLFELGRFRSHSYDDWLNRYQEFFQSFGDKPPACDAAPLPRTWRQWVFHPAWNFAWADQEELHYLETVQDELTILRGVENQRAWVELDQALKVHRENYHPPLASWRFYVRLPLMDALSNLPDRAGALLQQYPSCAWCRELTFAYL